MRLCAISLQLFGLFFYGGVFLINTQVAAIGIHSVFNAVLVGAQLANSTA